MTDWLMRLIDKNFSGTREAYGKLAGVLGIASNLLIATLKLIIGVASGSIAISADAVNNFSDCASSVITLAGFKLAARPADDEHPFGHARYEYISGLAVSILILVIGFQFLVSSIEKIIRPEPVEFNWFVICVLSFSIIIKLWQGAVNRKIGARIGSDALLATAADSLNDAIATAAVLAGAFAGRMTGLLLDGWMGLAVALFILVSGVRLVIDTLNPLLGAAPDRALTEKLEKKITGYESVLGVHDLIVHNYGPGRCFASVHVEVSAKQDILLSHDLIDNIERDVAEEMGIALVIHLDPLVTDDERLTGYQDTVLDAVRKIDSDLSVHDFRMTQGHTHTNLIFDIVIPPRYPLPDSQLRKAIGREVISRLGPAFYCVINIDKNYTTSHGR